MNGRDVSLGNIDLGIYCQKQMRKYILGEINKRIESKKKELELRNLYNSTEHSDIKMTGFSGSSRQGENRRSNK